MSTQQNRLLADYFYLAEASYADFSQARTESGYDNEDAAKDAMIKKKDSGDAEQPESLADLVLDNYEIAAHWKDRKEETSFSGALFKGKMGGSNPGKYILALKGSLEWEDFATDGADIVLDGLAHHQIVDMYNIWQQITHVGEYKVANIISGSELEELEKQERAKGIFAQDGYFIDSVVNNLRIPNPVRKSSSNMEICIYAVI